MLCNGVVMLNHLDLCSGIGGFALGLQRTRGFQTIAFCEIDPFCRQVLKKHWPAVPIFHDIREFKKDDLSEAIDIVTAGFPCQPYSLAGLRRGAEDDRALWPEVFRIVQTFRPAWFLGENVPGFITMELDQALSDLDSQGYETQTFVIPAAAVDAPHRRDRVWILAHTGYGTRRNQWASERRQIDKAGRKSCAGAACGPGHQSASLADAESNSRRLGLCENDPEKIRRLRSGYMGGIVSDSVFSGCGKGRQGGFIRSFEQLRQAERENVPDAQGQGLEERGQAGGQKGEGQEVRTVAFSGSERCCGSLWAVEPDVGRMAYGVPRRVDRLKALGNAVVPQIPELFGQVILEATTTVQEAEMP